MFMYNTYGFPLKNWITYALRPLNANVLRNYNCNKHRRYCMSHGR